VETGAGWEAFSAARVDELTRAGMPVFVNVTAAWCITCLVNERVALRSPAVAEAFARKGVVALKADWTRRDPAITAMLDAFGRSGVPLYLLYPAAPGGGPASAPQVLPQVLTESMVVEAVDRL
jgi:thiol:disulfide interchange protein DsbD